LQSFLENQMNNLLRSLRKTFLATAATSIASVAFANGVPFTIQESSVPGSVANAVTATRINFDHNEAISSGGLLGTGVGPTAGNGLFSESGFLTFTGFLNNGVTQLTQLNGFGATGYKLYGLFDFSGTIASDGLGGILYNPTNPASITLYLDPTADTTLTLPVGFAANGSSPGPVVRGNIGDDILLGSANSLSAAQGHIFPGLANGDFEGIFSNWLLTAAGSAFFVSPNPFYMTIDFNGNLTTVTGASPGRFAGTINGSGNSFFVPAPGVVILLGMGLAAVAVARRKK
jgi:hypothetical protein